MSSDEKTLVILTPGFAKDEADSTCIPMQQSFAKQLREVCPKLNIVILAFEYPYQQLTYQWHGNTVTSFDGRNRGAFTRWRVRKQVKAVLKKIYHSHNLIGVLSFWYGECALAGKRFADKFAVPHYCWMWGQDARIGNKYVKRTGLSAKELIVFSDFLQDEFERNYGIRPLHVITPGINAKDFPSATVTKDIDILAAGSLIALKQYEIFVDLIAEIKKEIPNIKAVLIGDGPKKSDLLTRTEGLGLGDNIEFTGELPHPDVLRLMQRSKIFLHPSSYEGFGIVCIEALYAGCEVISFVKPVNRDIPQWKIVATRDQMRQSTIQILKEAGGEYRSIMPFSIDDTVKGMMKLFES
jgi:glycosyltransferase involved in cell wall biosynthesis